MSSLNIDQIPKARRFAWIYDIGCVACLKIEIGFEPCQIHHLNLGGKAGQKRLGDRYTIGLCPWHHQGQVPSHMPKLGFKALRGPSLALSSREFRVKFGSDDELLAYQDELINGRLINARPEIHNKL